MPAIVGMAHSYRNRWRKRKPGQMARFFMQGKESGVFRTNTAAPEDH